MKNSWLFSLLLPGVLFANDASFLDVARFQVESFTSSLGQCSQPRPFGLLVTGDVISKAGKVRDSTQNIAYAEFETTALYGFKLDPLSGLSLGLGYGYTHMNWSANPFFNQTDFNYANVSILAYTGSIPGWFWQGGLSTQTIFKNFWDDSRFGGFLWGRYSCNPDLGFHVGFFALTGLNKTVVYPILGFDLEFCKRWELSAVFPVDMRLSYELADSWYLSAFIRPFLTRDICGSDEPIPHSIFEYRNIGYELNLAYDTGPLFVSLFAGITSNANLKVEGPGGTPLIYTHFDSAPYAGFNSFWAF